MKYIARFIIKLMLQKAKNDKFECNNEIIKRAYDFKIQSFETTLLYLSN